jgi:hypothetical protein
LKYSRLELFLVLASLGALSATATLLVSHFGWTLYYGDAEAHLNIARRILDSRTPGYDQIGTSWLPLPHLLTMALAGDDRLWRSGLAGAIPSSVCFVLAGTFLFAAMRRATKSSAAGFAALGLFALNPNLLYLQATPMTEPVFLAGFTAILYFTVLFRDTQSWGAVIGASIASLAASLSRYEGWFLIPFVTIYFLLEAKGWRRLIVAVIFAIIAVLAPLYWLGHNWWLYSNPLEFFNGPYSAQAINQRTGPYPGLHDWKKAWLFFRTVTQMCAGWGAIIVAAAGVLAVFWKRVFWPALLASLPAAFYLWSMYSGGAAIFVPQLWFNSYYNTRYGLSALPLFAIAGACTTLLAAVRWRPLVALAAIAIGASPWLIHPRPDDWICWKESQVNSESRRAWTREAAQILTSYQRGAGIFTSFGDLTGILREAGIPLREALHDGNEPAWMGAATRPNLFLHEEWAIAFSGDTVATTVQRATFKTGPRYHLERTIIIKGAPVIEIYKRD